LHPELEVDHARRPTSAPRRQRLPIPVLTDRAAAQPKSNSPARTSESYRMERCSSAATPICHAAKTPKDYDAFIQEWEKKYIDTSASFFA